MRNWSDIRALRESLGIPQKELASALGIPPTRYNVLENSVRPDLIRAALVFLQHRQEKNFRSLQKVLQAS